MSEIKQSWNTFKNKAFPKPYSGKEIDGIELSLLDTETAGCIQYFIATNSLDRERVAILESCNNDLEKVISKLEGEGKSYFQLLKKLSESVLRKVQNGPAG